MQAKLNVVLGREGEYQRCKMLLNRGKHPTFIGRGLVQSAAWRGGLLFFQDDSGKDIAVVIFNPKSSVLLVLSVLPQWRSSGIGTAIVDYIKCNFVRAIESSVPFFTRCGYQAVGKMKKGYRWRTQIMVRKELRNLAGRLKHLLAE